MTCEMPLHEYQTRMIDWLEHHESGYLAVDMGLGKTRTILEFIKKNKIQTTLVIAPLRVAVSTWPDEILKWTPELSYIVLHGYGKTENFNLKRNIYILNYDGLEWFNKMIQVHGRVKFKNALLVLDEATMVKSSRSRRFKILKELRIMFSRVIAMSATPSPNGYTDLWSQYYLLDYGRTLGTYETMFFNRYYRKLESHRVVPISNEKLKEIPKRVAPVTFRLAAEDYLKMPDFFVNDVYVDLPPRLYNDYCDLEKDFALNINGTEITAVNAAVLSAKLRQFCQGSIYSNTKVEPIHELKLDALESMVEQLGGKPVLVAVQFKFEIDNIRKRFGDVPAIYSGTTAAESAKLIEQWNKGQLPMLICHPASLSHGVNLQFGGHHIIWLALTWNLEHYTQFNGRLYRQGQKSSVIVHRILIRNSIEDKMAQALRNKNATQQDLLNVLKEVSNSWEEDNEEEV